MESKIKTYKVRWPLLLGIFIAGLNRQFTSTAFAVENNAIAHYFNVTNYEVDLLSIGDSFIAIIVCLLLSVFGKLFRLRAQCMTLVSFLTAGNLLTAIAFTRRTLYPCVVLGRLLTGLATGVYYILPATFANKWFPASQIATAFCVPFVGLGIGGVFCSLLIPHLMPHETIDQSEAEIKAVRIVYTAIFGVGAGLLMGIAVFFWIYAKNGPPTPPSGAEVYITQNRSHKKDFQLQSSLMSSLRLLKAREFVLLTAANFLSTSALVLFIVLMPSMVSDTFPEIDAAAIGYLNTAAYSCSIVSTLLCGRILDKFGAYKVFSSVGTGLVALFSIGLYVGHLKEYFPLICILYPLMFLSRTFTVSTFVEFLVEVTYPMNKTVVTSLHFAFYNLAFFVTASLERLAFRNCGSSCALLVPIIGNVLSLGCLLMVKPDYNRSKVNVSAGRVNGGELLPTKRCGTAFRPHVTDIPHLTVGTVTIVGSTYACDHGPSHLKGASRRACDLV